MRRDLYTWAPNTFCSMAATTLAMDTISAEEKVDVLLRYIVITDYPGNTGLDKMAAEVRELQDKTDPVAMATFARMNPDGAYSVEHMRKFQIKNPKKDEPPTKEKVDR